MNVFSINLKSFYVAILALYIAFSVFMSDYFFRLESNIKELIIFPLVLAFAFSIMFKSKINANWSAFIYLILIIIFYFVGLMNYAPDKFGIRYYLIPLIIYLVVRYVLNVVHQRRLVVFLWGYLWLILCVGLYEIISNISSLSELIQGINIFDNLKIIRSYLFFQIPNLAGLSLASLILFIYLNEERSVFKTITLSISFVVILYVFSKTAIVALVIAIIFYYFLIANRASKLLISLVLFFVLSYIIDVALNDESFLMRTGMWEEETLSMISGFGEGIGFVSVSSSAQGGLILDSDILRFLLEVGVMGFLSFLLFLFADSVKQKNYKASAYGFFILINMTMGDFHSMYPGVAISYICLALLLKKNCLHSKNTVGVCGS